MFKSLYCLSAGQITMCVDAIGLAKASMSKKLIKVLLYDNCCKCHPFLYRRCVIAMYQISEL